MKAEDTPIKHYHVFEGDGMPHGVRIRGGRASYRNRYVRTAGWKAENAAGRALYGSFLDALNQVFGAELYFTRTIIVDRRRSVPTVIHILRLGSHILFRISKF